MKKILKLSAILLSAAFCASGLFACNETPPPATEPGTIDGNYTETTAAQMSTSLSTIDTDAMNGYDETTGDAKTGWAFGVSASNNMTISVTSGTDTTTASLNLGLQYRGFETDAEIMNEVAATLSASLTQTGSAPASVTADASAYLNNENLWAALKTTGLPPMEDSGSSVDSNVDYKAVIDIVDLLSALMDDGTSGEPVSATSGEGESFFELDAATLAMLQQQFGLKYEADLTDGAKLKVSTTSDTKIAINALIAGAISQMNSDAADSSEQAELVLQAASFSKADVELYVHIDANGVLKQAAANIDLEGSVTVNGQTLTVGLTNVAEITFAPIATTVIPESVSSSTDYTDVDEVSLANMLKELLATHMPQE